MSEDPFDLETEYRSYILRKIVLILVMAVCIFLVAGYALSQNGFEGVGILETYDYIFKHITGYEFTDRIDRSCDYMIWNRYLPRAVMGIIVGAGLAICGVAMQSLMNNPLADPYTVGISDGACFGAVAAIVVGFSFSSLTSSMGIVVNAFIGGLIPALILILLSRAVNLTPATAILIGVALSYIFSGMETVLMTSTDADTLKNAFLWQIGTLNGSTWDNCIVPAVFMVVCSVFLMFSSRSLNLLSLGDDSAKSLGLNVDQFRLLCMIVVSVTVAAMVSYVGIIGFVGLVVPHIIRMIVGGDAKFLIPASMVGGALFILVADLLSRVLIAPEELRVGLIASIIGSPIFLYIIVRRRRGYGEVF